MPDNTIKLNLEGEVCPYPLIMTLKKFKEHANDLEAGKILEITLDHSPATENIAGEIEKQGGITETVKTGSAQWNMKIQKQKGGEIE